MADWGNPVRDTAPLFTIDIVKERRIGVMSAEATTLIWSNGVSNFVNHLGSTTTSPSFHVST